MKKIITESREMTVQAGENFGKGLEKGDIVAFKGGLGAGKTAFTSGIVLGLGLANAEVSSPTFAIVNEYRSKDFNVYHFDMYRIQGEEGLESTGFFDYDFENNVTIIEWSENITEFLPKRTIYVTIIPIDENKREIIIEGGREDVTSWN